ncbi:MAG: leucine-rich repeat domain-containing protein [Salinivirgaceae bacterium]|nr:leucine-rich repeat domain-containing protein [Salinivirgaceae bacterium]MBR6082013.1 leucine-rich repeat domain-containing protein [Salinivirgaceae bacterium]
MRKIFTLMFVVMLAGQAWAQTTFTIGQLKYTVTDATNHYVSVGAINYDIVGDIVIPSTVENKGVTYSVTSIESGAFYCCWEMTSVILPNTIITIGQQAFNCCGLNSISIPESVTTIGVNAFGGCHDMSEINVTGGNANYSSKDGVLFNKNNTILISYPAGKPNTYTIPNTVICIEDYAFCGCENLELITIPSSVNKIGEGAFIGVSLIKVEFASIESLLKIDFEDLNANPLWSSGHLYLDGTEVTEVTIPETVDSIKDYAFAGCTSLTTVVIPKTVTSIGKSAFCNVKNIVYSGESEGTPWSAKSVGVLIDENGLIFADSAKTQLVAYTGNITNITIPNSVASIGDEAFRDCSGLTSISIPNSVISIGDEAFRNCSGLTSISIPNTVAAIGKGAFRYCSGLISISIPDSVTAIGEYAFYNCSNLTSVNMPNSIKSIGEYAFGFCYNLTSINIPDSVTAIGKYAFYNCSSLTSVNIPNSIKEISDYMFDGCYNLSKVSIPNSITRIGQQAFEHCYRLSLAIPGSVKTIGLGAFDFVANIIYTGNVEGSEALTVNGIIDGDFIYSDAEKTNLTAYTGEGGDVVIPDGVISIGEMVFNRSKLTSVIIGNSVKNIGMSAFEGCSCLTSVTLGESVKSIELWAFANCTGLTSITIPKSVIKMGSLIFEGDQNLTIYCEVSSKPEDWDSDWNCYDFGKNYFCTVVWAGRTPVTEMAANAVNIYAYGNTIVVENATDEINVYNVMGTLVCRDVALNVSTVAKSGIRTELQVSGTGVYIVKVGNIAKQVMVND